MNWLLLVVFLLTGNILCTYASDTLKHSELEQYEGVKYLTFTKENENNAVDIRNVNFNDNYVNVFVIHGFEMKKLDKPLQVKNDLFQFNPNVGRVIIVSWLEYSSGKFLRFTVIASPRIQLC